MLFKKKTNRRETEGKKRLYTVQGYLNIELLIHAKNKMNTVLVIHTRKKD